MRRIPAAALLVTVAGCDRPPLLDCPIERYIDVSPDAVTDLGYSANDAAAHFTFVETVTATDGDGAPIELRLEVTASTGRTQYGAFEPANDTISCPLGQLSVGEMDVRIIADGVLDERVNAWLGTTGPLAVASTAAESEVGLEDLEGTWRPRTFDDYGGRAAYMVVAVTGGDAHGHIEHIEIGGLTRCHPKGGCDRAPEIGYDAP